MTYLIVLLVLVGGAIAFVAMIYNSLIQKRVATNNAWSQISVQLKRRHDLIPNLVETVKGYAKHEQETLAKALGDSSRTA